MHVKVKNIQEIAEWYCETCLKCFCSQCNHHHSQLYSYHTTCGRGDLNKWPLTKKIEDFLQKSDVHKDERLKMFCQDHDQLCCT
ncbi:hypothetical protein DPMN_064978 [Dreissena polymorpha]|uniref:B box-type domain-containing protein n=1 Tax=Dreissena polymorpha TaxID=45954 RepID=A0A9D4HLI7_DREPO|nr:hypothetical protein DPMN_064978 [Dreissena polymorpha]